VVEHVALESGGVIPEFLNSVACEVSLHRHLGVSGFRFPVVDYTWKTTRVQEIDQERGARLSFAARARATIGRVTRRDHQCAKVSFLAMTKCRMMPFFQRTNDDRRAIVSVVELGAAHARHARPGAERW